MTDSDETSSDDPAGHTLACMQRLDRRINGLEKTMIQVVGSLSQVLTKIDRSDRNNKEAFARIGRDRQGIKSDAIVSENKILDRYSETLDPSRRVNEHDRRLDAIENPIIPKF